MIDCPCPGAAGGAQTCKPDGTYGACTCKTASTNAPAPSDKTPALCNAAGRWQFRGLFEKNGAGCSHRKSFTDTLNIVRDRKGNYAVRARMVNGEHKMAIKDDGGACVMSWEEQVNEVPSGTPDYVAYKMTLRESDGQVSGEGVYSDIDDDKPEQDVARCRESFALKGTKRALTKADLDLDKAIVRKDFETFMGFIDRCQLPTLKKGTRGASVELTISARGGLDVLMVNGVDQDVAQNCDAFLGENRLGLFANPTARRQKVAFVYP
jgi:hypothetical protein